MNKHFARLLAVLVLTSAPPLLPADFLKDNTMQEGLSVWKGDGEVAYLNADGTEGAEGDKGVTQVIKVTLSKSHARSVYQDYHAPTDLAHLNVGVEVFASLDFKRSKFSSDYSPDIHWTPGSTWYWSAEAVPDVDFWIRGAPGFQYQVAGLKPGQWVTVRASWDAGLSATDRTVGFFVPPGEGAVYIRKATAGQ